MGGTIGPAPLLPRREDPSVANIIAGFCTTGFLPVSLFLEIMATGLKRKPPPPPEPHRTGMLVRLLAKILCLPSQTSFVTICFAFVLEFLPSNLPRFRRERSNERHEPGRLHFSPISRGIMGTTKYPFERLILWFLRIYIYRSCDEIKFNRNFFVSDFVWCQSNYWELEGYVSIEFLRQIIRK